MPRDVKKFLVWIAVASVLIGFAAGDRRDPFSLTAAATAFALLFTTAMALGSHFASRPTAPGGKSKSENSAVVSAAGAAFLEPIGMAFRAGESGNDGASAPWLARVITGPEIGPGIRAAATNACHYAFEIGKSVLEGHLSHDEALKMSAAESARQFYFAANNQRALPPLRHDPSATLPPTLARQRPAPGAHTTNPSPRQEEPHDAALQRVNDWASGMHAHRLFMDIERRASKLADEFFSLPAFNLFNRRMMAPFFMENAQPFLAGLIATRRATGPRYFILSEWKLLLDLIEASMTKSSLATLESLETGKSKNPDTEARTKALCKQQVNELRAMMLRFSISSDFKSRRLDMIQSVANLFLKSIGLKGEDASGDSEVGKLLSRTIGDVMAATD